MDDYHLIDVDEDDYDYHLIDVDEDDYGYHLIDVDEDDYVNDKMHGNNRNIFNKKVNTRLEF